jgi:hypothetical protein
VQAPASQTSVQVERQEPNVRIERTGEPQIVVRQAEGQPLIRFEPTGGAAAGTPPAPLAGAPAPASDPRHALAQITNPQTGYGTHTPPVTAVVPSPAAPAPGPQTTGALPPADMQAVPVSRLEDMTLYNAREEKLGEVEAVVSGAGGRTFLIVSHGGFLGLGEKQVAVPLDQLALRGERLVAVGLSDDEIRGLPAYERSAGFREVEDSQSAPIRTLR